MCLPTFQAGRMKGRRELLGWHEVHMGKCPFRVQLRRVTDWHCKPESLG